MPGLGLILDKEEITLAKQMRKPDRGQESKTNLRTGRIILAVLGFSMQAKTLLHLQHVNACRTFISIQSGVKEFATGINIEIAFLLRAFPLLGQLPLVTSR